MPRAAVGYCRTAAGFSGICASFSGDFIMSPAGGEDRRRKTCPRREHDAKQDHEHAGECLQPDPLLGHHDSPNGPEQRMR